MAKKQMEIPVVGMRYSVTPSTLAKLAHDVPLRCILEREPDNAHDENAVKVLVVEKPWGKSHAGLPIGHVARAVASVIAPAIDAGGDQWPYKEAWLTEIDEDEASGIVLLSQKPLG